MTLYTTYQDINNQSNSQSNYQAKVRLVQPQPLYSPKQVYAIEKAWFDKGYVSYGLMTQAAWQMSQWIEQNTYNNGHSNSRKPQACVWTGSGNNGGDGWLIGYFLTQLGWQVTVIEVAPSSAKDANKAKSQAMNIVDNVIEFDQTFNQDKINIIADVYVDALFGIGLDKAPSGDYQLAIECFNHQVAQAKSYMNHDRPKVIAVDVPSGVVASTGQVYESRAIKADVTLCLVARKAGLHTKDAMDYCGDIIDLTLIPINQAIAPQAWLHYHPKPISQRQNNTHKGSFGHVLIIGGNYESDKENPDSQNLTQGMGGAAILAASTAMATGVGKVTVLCHAKFHHAVISSLPNAMVMDLVHATEQHNHLDKLTAFIKQADSAALGMGLGRNDKSYQLFICYLQAIIHANVPMVIDADGLYHLASLARCQRNHEQSLLAKLKQYSASQSVWFTPHSGEAARLLDRSVFDVEANRFDAIEALANKFGGCWLLKGAGSLVYDTNDDSIAVCALGNAGMATAGMGDVLAGHAAALQAQTDLDNTQRDLLQAVMIHAMAGDLQAKRVGTWQLQAQDMADAIGEVMQTISHIDFSLDSDNGIYLNDI